MTKKDKREKPRRLYLVDASSMAFRAYHATMRQRLSTSEGLPTGATLVFTNMMNKLVREEDPTHLVVVWDPGGKTFRHERYPEYKANREAMPEDLATQFGYMRRIVEAFNFASVEIEGYEADDVIATLAEKAGAEGVETVIVSGDKDLMQLVGPGVTMLDTLKDVRYDADKVREKLGVGPERVTDALGLMGDSSDNVPGVPKVGDKTARKLLEEYDSMEAVLEHADEIKGKVGENLKQYADQARLSKELVTVIRNLDLDPDWEKFRVKPPDRQKLTGLFRELEFNRLLSEFGEHKGKIGHEGYRVVKDEDGLREFMKEVEKEGRLAIDTETDSTRPVRAGLVGISMAARPGEAVYVPLAHTGEGSRGQPAWDAVREIIRPALESGDVLKILQNMKYDYIVLVRHGIEIRGPAFDTMVASYLLNPRRRAHNLSDLCAELLDHRMIKYEDLCGKGKAQIPFAEVPVEDACRYSCEDVDVTLRLHHLLRSGLEREDLLELFNRVEMPLVPVLARMEMAGVKVDTKKLKRMSKEFDKKIKVLRDEICRLAGKEFNPDSPKQLSKILFTDLGLPTGKKTKTGFSTSEEVLNGLADDYEIARKVLDYRGLSKLKNTYTDALAKMTNPETGRIHTSYNQTITSTGRLSSSEPNLQNIPVRSAEGRMIREAFVGEGDNLIVSADYSQIELRLMAHISGEPALLEAFRRGEDIHARTASEIMGVKQDQVTPDMRRRAKVVNFGILYGMSAHGLTRQLGVNHEEAQAYINSYFARYPKVREYMDRTLEQARKHGYVKTIMGRKLLLPEINAKNSIARAASEREAVNGPLQGSAADIIKVAMIRIDRELSKRRLGSKMIMQVHDELVFEALPEELDEVTALAVELMSGAAKLSVALAVEVSAAKNWAEAH